MSEPVLAEAVCQRCKGALDAGDNYCPHCGGPTATASRDSFLPKPVNAIAAPAASAARPEFLESVWGLLVLFAVIGPLALPLLWRNRRYSRFWKISLTVLVLALTVLLLWLLWYVVQQALKPLGELQELYRS